MSKSITEIINSLDDDDKRLMKQEYGRLQSKNQMYKTILERSPICTKFIDTDQRLYYMSSAGVIGLKIPDITVFYDKFYPPIGMSQVLSDLYAEHFPKALKGETSMFECPIPDINGHEEWYITHLIPVYDDNEKDVKFVLVTSSNITQRKESEFETERLHRDLSDVSREIGMAEVAINVLHNIGNILNSINISLESLSENKGQSSVFKVCDLLKLFEENIENISSSFKSKERSEAIRKYIPALRKKLSKDYDKESETIKSISEYLDLIKATIATQLQYVKKPVLIEKIHFNEVLEDFLKLQKNHFNNHKIMLNNTIDKQIEICADRYSLLMVLINLMNNACDSLLESNLSEKVITLSVSDKTNHICVAIKDNGVGISEEVLPHILEHGFTTKKSGYGFGMASAALAVNKMGGEILIESKGINQGATVQFTLPKQAPST
ncbi:MAG: ATP-binding protein [Coxiellaceae bacterium]|nr:ATP-binding protein [Coxiellaceae bacterium]